MFPLLSNQVLFPTKPCLCPLPCPLTLQYSLCSHIPSKKRPFISMSPSSFLDFVQLSRSVPMALTFKHIETLEDWGIWFGYLTLELESTYLYVMPRVRMEGVFYTAVILTRRWMFSPATWRPWKGRKQPFARPAACQLSRVHCYRFAKAVTILLPAKPYMGVRMHCLNLFFPR